jgi:thioredoxin-related protein
MKTLFRTLAFLLVCPLSLAAAPPENKARTEKPAVLKPVYDEKADAQKQLAAALASARRGHRRVLIQWGGNWCPWCLVLHERLGRDPELSRILRYEYELVLIDIGRREKNLDLAAGYGADLKANGIPFWTVLDADGKVVANQPTEPFEVRSADGQRGHDTAKLKAFLTAHQAQPPRAEAVLTAALQEAARSQRGVLVHFGSPSCGWCRRLDAWLARPEVASLLGRDFVEVGIDLARMGGAAEVFSRYNPSKKGGIPWLVLLDARGKSVATSDGPRGNIGFPSEPHEIDHFVAMLQAARHRLSAQDVARLRQLLTPAAGEAAP